MSFDINNPNDRAACICGQAGFTGGVYRDLTWQNRIVIGRAVQEQFPDLDYKALWTHLLWLPKPEREAIRARALNKIKGGSSGVPR
jgi:hypothetical protein